MNSTQTIERFTEKGTHIANMIISALAVEGIKANITITYLDYGQNWMWETVLVHGKNGAYQALNPNQFKDMNSGDFDYAQIHQIVDAAKNLS